jgi:glycosyltransferase involved in cell wall biosynthesis
MPAKPKLLMLSPVRPARSGFGLAMRAGAWVDVLRPHCDAHLLVAPIFDARAGRRPARHAVLDVPMHILSRPPGSRVADFFAAWIGRWRRRKLPPEAAWFERRRAPGDARLFPGVTFDALLVFRTYLIGLAESLSARCRPQALRLLDVDDIESISRRRLAGLHAREGDLDQAAREQADADFFERIERERLPAFDRVFAASELDAGRLRRWGCPRVDVFPNVVRIPPEPDPPQEGGPMTFLMLGNMNHFPNRDAVLFFCRDVLPGLRALAGQPFRIRVVGHGRRRFTLRPRPPELEWVGPVDDVAPWYRDAHAVVAPLRAGGGTRIKILEAFSYRRPVVSTSVGVEGLDVVPEQHLLIADEPGALAVRCAQLLEDGALRQRLAELAFAWVEQRHTLAAAEWRIGPLLRPGAR